MSGEVETLRILAIDDDPLVLKAIARLLRPHDVEAVDDPLVALVQLDAGAEYDVIICDLFMVRRSGMALFDQVTKLRPELADRFVFLTGNGGEEIEAFLARPEIRVVRKPFDYKLLRDVVEAVGRTTRGL